MLIRKGTVEKNVSPKAFRLLYKAQGYEEMVKTPKVSEDTEEREETNSGDVEIVKTLNQMKVEELKTLAKEHGIEGCSQLKKDALIEILKDVI